MPMSLPSSSQESVVNVPAPSAAATTPRPSPFARPRRVSSIVQAPNATGQVHPANVYPLVSSQSTLSPRLGHAIRADRYDPPGSTPIARPVYDSVPPQRLAENTRPTYTSTVLQTPTSNTTPSSSKNCSNAPNAGKTFKRKNFKQLSLPTVHGQSTQRQTPTLSLNGLVPSRSSSTTPSNTSTSTSTSRSRSNSHTAKPDLLLASIDDAQVPGGLAEMSYHNNLVQQLATLEIGVEFRLDFHIEDLKTIEELGSGNGGTVSKVMHLPTKTLMAKKMINIEARPAVRKQIVRELHIMHECHSKYIVSFYGAFVNEGDVVMCMEYMDCLSLDHISKKMGPLEESILGKITEAVVEGLTYLYNLNRIIHRDVKPSNVLVNSHGQIKLCDFGVSGELINSIADTFVGTSTYMSPERIQGAAYSVKGDVWSLGLMLLQLAIGHFPFDRPDSTPLGILDLLQQIVNEPVPTLPDDGKFSIEFRNCIDQCLIKDVDQRPTPQDLLSGQFIIESKKTFVDTEAWAKSTL
ncbi:kinase-like domain-containing protein [Lipomyces arxii]|uniref:kinase-like domain-containing protein n=1 Tax=Lipomyces arxii TaxID=56418 RepID=UPI0034CEFB1A